MGIIKVSSCYPQRLVLTQRSGFSLFDKLATLLAIIVSMFLDHQDWDPLCVEIVFFPLLKVLRHFTDKVTEVSHGKMKSDISCLNCW